MTEDSGDIEEHPPAVDIDQYVQKCNFRIERMDGDAIWLAAYTDDGEPDHHYDLRVTEDGGLHVSHRTEYPDQ